MNNQTRETQQQNSQHPQHQQQQLNPPLVTSSPGMTIPVTLAPGPGIPNQYNHHSQGYPPSIQPFHPGNSNYPPLPPPQPPPQFLHHNPSPSGSHQPPPPQLYQQMGVPPQQVPGSYIVYGSYSPPHHQHSPAGILPPTPNHIFIQHQQSQQAQFQQAQPNPPQNTDSQTQLQPVRYNTQKSTRSPSSEDQELKKKRKRLSISCTTCRKRKIKCDRQRPICGLCQKNNVPVHLCIYDDSPWVSSLVKEQSLQTEIDSLSAQKQKLKDVIAAKDNEIVKLKAKLEHNSAKNKSESGVKNISINSLVNLDEEDEGFEEPQTDVKKFVTFSENQFDGIFTLDNTILLTPSLRGVFQSVQKKKNVYKEYSKYDLQDFAQDFPPFKLFDSRFQYIFDINFRPEFQFMMIFRDSDALRTIFHNNFNRKQKINMATGNSLEICLCLLILQISVSFNSDNEFCDQEKLLSICHIMIKEKLQEQTYDPLLLENLLLYNNLVNIVAINLDSSNVTVRNWISQIVNRQGLLHRVIDKNLWAMALYQDFLISLSTGLPLEIFESQQIEIDEDDFDDVFLSSIMLVRKVYRSFQEASVDTNDDHVLASEMSLIHFTDNQYLKFDPNFILHFHIRTSESGSNKDKRLVIHLLFCDLLVGIKFLKYLDHGDLSIVQILILEMTFFDWYFEQAITEESMSKNRCLQIAISPVLKILILRAMTILFNFIEDKEEQGLGVDLWSFPLHELEKIVVDKSRKLSTTQFKFPMHQKIVSKLLESVEKVDLFKKDKNWMEDFTRLAELTLKVVPPAKEEVLQNHESQELLKEDL